jgi:hypothetical protein
VVADPISLYDKVAKSRTKLRLKEQSLIHGDLHISNVALDVFEGHAEAYIFDPGVSSRDVAGRDCAVLEVSSFLHQNIEFGTIVELCSIFYGNDSPDKVADKTSVDKLCTNVTEFIKQIRGAALELNSINVYALMIFDYALVQVGGLAYGLSGNMIKNPQAAVYYLGAVANWYQKIRDADVADSSLNVMDDRATGRLQRVT